ncbi:MAG TPA: TIGR03084 family metal-binding protein [Acidimicrobiales bacterium]|nr:TIGR03084 family metal-binding protein [Acidimicrobiales bacterium]
MPGPDLASLCDDLAAEHSDLDAVVSPLDTATWDEPTPAAGWAVRDQIHHLAWFDRNAVLAVEDSDAFTAKMNEMVGEFAAFEATLANEARSMAPDELLQWWRDGRVELLRVVRNADPTLRVPWYGPPMAVASFTTARLMETWAHGQDVVDAVGATRTPTNRLRHIAHIGVRTRGFAYTIRNRPLPDADVRVELAAPDGSAWTWGSDDATDRVHGPAFDFCLVVTQRRHIDDTSLVADGPLAVEWMSIAQAFAGGPGEGRTPGQFAHT